MQIAARSSVDPQQRSHYCDECWKLHSDLFGVMPRFLMTWWTRVISHPNENAWSNQASVYVREIQSWISNPFDMAGVFGTDV